MASKAYAATEICEVRYERGYRYLDRCGDAMVVLEQLFGELTGEIWIPAELKPTGASLKCPALDALLLMSTDHVVLQVEGIQRETMEGKLFDELAESALSVAKGKFQIGQIVRIGFRTMFNVPFETLDEARNLLMSRITPDLPQNVPVVGGFSLRDYDRALHFFDEEGQDGYTLRTSVAERFDAPPESDPRLQGSAKLVGDALRKALLDQMQRRSKPSLFPAATVIDVDHFRVRPRVFESLGRYMRTCREINSNILEAFLPERHRP